MILGGEIDLSTETLCPYRLWRCFIDGAGVNMWVAIVIVLIVGSLIGALTGVVITFLKIPSFIASLGMSYVILGATLLLTNSEQYLGYQRSS